MAMAAEAWGFQFAVCTGVAGRRALAALHHDNARPPHAFSSQIVMPSVGLTHH